MARLRLHPPTAKMGIFWPGALHRGPEGGGTSWHQLQKRSSKLSVVVVVFCPKENASKMVTQGQWMKFCSSRLNTDTPTPHPDTCKSHRHTPPSQGTGHATRTPPTRPPEQGTLASRSGSARPDLLSTEEHQPEAHSVLAPKPLHPSPRQHAILSLCSNDKVYQAKRAFSHKNREAPGKLPGTRQLQHSGEGSAALGWGSRSKAQVVRQGLQSAQRHWVFDKTPKWIRTLDFQHFSHSLIPLICVFSPTL